MLRLGMALLWTAVTVVLAHRMEIGLAVLVIAIAAFVVKVTLAEHR